MSYFLAFGRRILLYRENTGESSYSSARKQKTSANLVISWQTSLFFRNQESFHLFLERMPIYHLIFACNSPESLISVKSS